MAGFHEFFEERKNVIFIISLVYILTCVFIYLLFLWKRVKIPKFPRKILLITSHPDDECMFFSPTIQAETSKGNFVYILCLTKGNFYKAGDRRKNELIRSCNILGIPARNVKLVDHAELPDNPNVDWNKDVLEKEILAVIYGLQPNKVITFDSYGVSGHRNHKAVYHAVSDICNKNRMPRHSRVFVLKSTSVLRKYSSILDLPLAYLKANRTFVSSPWKTIMAWRAMFAHRSQLMWFRILYLMFSNYMFVNSLHQVCHHGDC